MLGGKPLLGLNIDEALSAIGPGHVPPECLRRAPYLTKLFARSEELARVVYVHRRQADGSPHEAVALVGRL